MSKVGRMLFFMPILILFKAINFTSYSLAILQISEISLYDANLLYKYGKGPFTVECHPENPHSVLVSRTTFRSHCPCNLQLVLVQNEWCPKCTLKIQCICQHWIVWYKCTTWSGGSVFPNVVHAQLSVQCDFSPFKLNGLKLHCSELHVNRPGTRSAILCTSQAVPSVNGP